MIREIPYILMVFNLVLLGGITEGRQFKKPDISGVIVPLFTPYKNGTTEVDVTKIDALGKYYAEKGVSGLLVLGKSGEGNLFNEAECKAIYKESVAVGKRYGLKTLCLVGPPTPLGLILAQFCGTIGCDVILTLPGLFFPPFDAAGVVNDIKLVADKAKNTAIMLYVDPATKPDCVRMEQVYKMAVEKIPNFIGFRCNLELCLQIQSASLYNPSQQVLLVTNHYAIKAAFNLGFNASVAVASAIAPDVAVAIQKAKTDKEAARNQNRINEIILKSVKSPRYYIPFTKTAVSLVSGICLGGVRPPLEDVTCEEKQRITTNLQNLKLIKAGPAQCC